MRTPDRALIDYENDSTVELLKAEIVLTHMRAIGQVPLTRHQYDFSEKKLIEVQSVAYDDQANMYASMLYAHGRTYYPELFPAEDTKTCP